MAFIVGTKRISQRLVLALGALTYLALIIVCAVINNQSFGNRQMSGLEEINSNSINATNQILSFNSNNLNLVDASDFLQQVNSAIPMTEAHSVTYPFDTYSTTISQMVKEIKSQQSIPFTYSFSGTIDLWRSDIEVGTTAVANERVFMISLRRTTITIIFSLFLYMIMWVLSGAAFIVTMTIWTRGRKVEPPTIAAVGAILFALPTIRNAQPGAPPVGCNADILAFFPCMLLVTCSVFMGLINYIVVYKANKEKLI
ncbi:hypothetical protein HDV04_002853 [Boothiomyces sp. JEL0838]|nr:hypothetical protein HDV04_002853 [Boothiomyces sp. JEL0838]